MSPSVTGKSSIRRHSSRRSISSEEDRGPSPRKRERAPLSISHRSRNPSHRERSPSSHKSSHRDKGGAPSLERQSPKREKRSSHVSRSPSPRTKRLRRAHAEMEVDKSSGRAHEGNHEKGHDMSKHDKRYRERGSEKEAFKDKRERRPENERTRDRERSKDRGIDKDRERSKDRGIDKDRERNAVERGSSRLKHKRSESPSDRHHHQSRHHSPSPPTASRSRARDEDEDSTRAEYQDDESDAVAQMKAAEQALETKEKQKPSFELSGKLAEETNRVRGVTLLFTEPPDARKPDMRWRLYVFKGSEMLNEPLYVHRQSCYLFGRERRIADIPTDHPSCSKQHAVLQYRQVEVEQPDGMISKQINPYLMDLGSTNKTLINDSPLEPQRYYELLEKDTIKFGNSSREYVILHENSGN